MTDSPLPASHFTSARDGTALPAAGHAAELQANKNFVLAILTGCQQAMTPYAKAGRGASVPPFGQIFAEQISKMRNKTLQFEVRMMVSSDQELLLTWLARRARRNVTAGDALRPDIVARAFDPKEVTQTRTRLANNQKRDISPVEPIEGPTPVRSEYYPIAGI